MYRFPSFKHSNYLFFHEQYDGVNGKMFWWLMKIFFLTVSWLSGLLSAEIFISTGEWGGPDATPDLWKQPFSAVRASWGYPGSTLKHPVTIICVIQSMFYQFYFNPEHKNYPRFLWWENGNIKSQTSKGLQNGCPSHRSHIISRMLEFCN